MLYNKIYFNIYCHVLWPTFFCSQPIILLFSTEGRSGQFLPREWPPKWRSSCSPKSIIIGIYIWFICRNTLLAPRLTYVHVVHDENVLRWSNRIHTLTYSHMHTHTHVMNTQAKSVFPRREFIIIIYFFHLLCGASSAREQKKTRVRTPIRADHLDSDHTILFTLSERSHKPCVFIMSRCFVSFLLRAISRLTSWLRCDVRSYMPSYVRWCNALRQARLQRIECD